MPTAPKHEQGSGGLDRRFLAGLPAGAAALAFTSRARAQSHPGPL